jgi:predicted metalloprotease
MSPTDYVQDQENEKSGQGSTKGCRAIVVVIIIIIIQLFIIYVPSQQPQGQLQTQHLRDRHNLKSGTNYTQALEENHINAEK